MITVGDPVVVVGGGIAGASIAKTLAVDQSVTVVEREAPAAGATGRSAGLVAPTLFYGDRPALARAATDRLRSLDGTGAFTFTERPRLDFIAESDLKAERRRARRLAEDGFPITYLDRDAVAERYPQIDLGPYPGAVWYGDTGWVDPYTYAVTLLELAADRGAKIETGVEVTGLRIRNGEVTGVETTAGFRAASTVVLATGWRTRELLPALSLPLQPYRTQCLVLEPEQPLDDSFPLGRISDEELYFRPEHNGDLLVGGAAHTCDDPGRASMYADESFERTVASVIPDHLDGFSEATVVDGWAGFDAATPDARPLIGRVPDGPSNLIVAAGFNGLGVMIAPIVGPVVRAALGGPSAPEGADCFDPSRFDDVEAFEFRSTADV